MGEGDSAINAALRSFEAAEANLEKLERLLRELAKLRPAFIAFGSDLKYDELSLAYSDVLQVLPAIDGWKPVETPIELSSLAQWRLDAHELGEPDAIARVEEAVQAPERELVVYRHRLNKKRRQLTRDALLDVMAQTDQLLRVLQVRYPAGTGIAVGEKVADAEFEVLKRRIQEIDALLGSGFRRPERWVDLRRHLHFGLVGDLNDILNVDWPTVRAGLSAGIYDENEPIPVGVEDLGRLASSQPRGSVATRLNWESLTAEDFERLLFALISRTHGYENPAWLMKTNAPDRGRDLSATRVANDLLGGVIRSRVIVQCKHWLSRSVSIGDISELKDQMKLWEPPRVDVLVVATSGRFSSDAVLMIERHNNEDRALRIEMWPESHLEHLLAERPSVIADFKLR